MEHSNVVKVRAQWQLENLPRRHPGIDGDDYADDDVDEYFQWLSEFVLNVSLIS